MSANLENSGPRPAGSRLDLINATVAAIARHGLSDLTSAKIAGMAGHTAASINFHFGSKEALLLATLREVSEEFAETIAAELAAAGDDPLTGLLSIIDASISLRLSDSRKVAVWYAFLAESNARKDYQRICGDRDQSFCQTVTKFCKRLIEGHEAGGWPNADAVSLGLTGLIDQLWQSILFEGDEFDREAARRQCRAYLGSVFPWTIERLQAPAVIQPKAGAVAPVEPAAEEGLRYTLPAWIYHSEEFHALEREHLFLPGWQIVCHVSEVAKTGDYVAFEMFGARGFVVRGEDGTLRGFHNSCRHRAHAVVSGERGNCPKERHRRRATDERVRQLVRSQTFGQGARTSKAMVGTCDCRRRCACPLRRGGRRRCSPGQRSGPLAVVRCPRGCGHRRFGLQRLDRSVTVAMEGVCWCCCGRHCSRRIRRRTGSFA